MAFFLSFSHPDSVRAFVRACISIVARGSTISFEYCIFLMVANSKLPYLRQLNTHQIMKLNLCFFVDILLMFCCFFFFSLTCVWMRVHVCVPSTCILKCLSSEKCVSMCVSFCKNGEDINDKRKSCTLPNLLLWMEAKATNAASIRYHWRLRYAWLSQKVTGGVFFSL